ncbi:MAG: radical SAM protein, partial [Desulfatiglandales bacterium]|nr:radical SAM protein [Desulfatiglandales bacterium]
MSEIEDYEIGAIRPPSEGGSHSLLLRFTRNCPWSNCTFCHGFPYQRAKFQLRTVNEIKGDIDKVKVIYDLIMETSKGLGLKGKVTQDVASSLFSKHPGSRSVPGFITLFNWLYVGGKTVFLQDADTLIMKTPDLVEAITYLKKTFPFIERITSYARAITAFKKSAEDLDALKKAGLTRLHIGLETGDDELLKKIRKGVTAEQHVRAGQKIMKAGIELSDYIMPGLGGKELTDQHARNTASVLNQIDPDFIRSRPFQPIPGVPRTEEYLSGDFSLLLPHELLREIGQLIEALTVSSRLCFDHAMNPSIKSGFTFTPLFSQSYEGYKLPDGKRDLLTII